jgi:2-polyprenyl-6-methoxyphenol hydroxylase-like FAD-dependent oxidoreductase
MDPQAIDTTQVDEFDVAIVGYGPVGQTMAALMGALGHKVIVFEKHHDLFANARAGHLDHEILRMWDTIGVTERLDDRFQILDKYRWLNGEGKSLLDIEYAYNEGGYAMDYDCYQPDFETALATFSEGQPNVEVQRGWEVIEAESGDTVRLVAERRARKDDGSTSGTGELRTVRAKYAVATDGGRSPMRGLLGLAMTDIGLEYRPYISVDTREFVDLSERKIQVAGHEYVMGKSDLWLVCDPDRPYFTMPAGVEFRKFAWFLNPDEKVEDHLTPAGAWPMIAKWGIGPDDVEIVRISEFVFEAKIANTFRVANTFFAGDSAHLMPPLMGQGLRTGLRDAKNLSWKLDLVLRGVVDESILDTYEQERKPHSEQWIMASVAANDVFITSDKEKARARDEAFFNHEFPEPPHAPSLTGDLLARTGADTETLPGLLSPQGYVSDGEKTGHLERIDPSFGFRFMFRNSESAEWVTEASRSVIDALDASIVTFAGTPDLASRRFSDTGGAYSQFLDDNELGALIIRPDFYVYGGARTAEEFEALVDELGTRLRLGNMARPTPTSA